MAADGPQSSGPRLFKEGGSRYPQLPGQVIVHLLRTTTGCPAGSATTGLKAFSSGWWFYWLQCIAVPLLAPTKTHTEQKKKLPSTSGSHLLFFYRFYAENITHLKDIITIELFFLNSKCAVYNVSSSFERMKHDSAQLLICLAEHLLMIHSLWTLIACQLSRRSLQGISFSEKTAGQKKQRKKKKKRPS